MKLKTLLLAGVAALFTSRSFAQVTATPSVFLASAQYGNSRQGLNFGGGELAGDTLAIGVFAIVLVLGACFGRCHARRKKEE